MEISSKTPEYKMKTRENSLNNACGQKKSKTNKDVFKDTPVRNFAFTDEIGEALRPVLSASSSRVVRALPNFAYIPAAAFLAADVADKYKNGDERTGQKSGIKTAAKEALYQGVVSIIAPAAIIRGTRKFLNKLSANPPEFVVKNAKKAKELLSKNKIGTKIAEHSGMIGKIAEAAVSVIAVTQLSKPVDRIVDKFFNKPKTTD